MFGEALDLYRLEKHRYPTTEESLNALKPYLKKDLPKDPWGHEYAYRSPGEDERDYDIVSYGADGTPGGDGNNSDIVSWKNLE
jgi:general secretion pathway protein G